MERGSRVRGTRGGGRAANAMGAGAERGGGSDGYSLGKTQRKREDDAPGAVMVRAATPSSLPIWCLTKSKRAMSTANAMSVRSAARKDVSDARSVSVTCEESESRNAMSVTPVAVCACVRCSNFSMRATNDHTLHACAGDGGRTDGVDGEPAGPGGPDGHGAVVVVGVDGRGVRVAGGVADAVSVVLVPAPGPARSMRRLSISRYDASSVYSPATELRTKTPW